MTKQSDDERKSNDVKCNDKKKNRVSSNIFIFSVSTLSRAAKPHGAWNKMYVLKRHFITLISYYKLLIKHFSLWSYKILVKISDSLLNLSFYIDFIKFCELYSLLGRRRQFHGGQLQAIKEAFTTLVICCKNCFEL